jgi:hypothetical protein
VAKRVQDIYIRDRQIVQEKYRQKHLAQLQVAQTYEQVARPPSPSRLVLLTPTATLPAALRSGCWMRSGGE